MIRKNLSFILASLFVLVISSCGNNEKKDASTESPSAPNESNTPSTETVNDPKGVGKFKNVELTHPLDEKMVSSGKSIYDVKCASCHKLTNEKLVGPGWKGVTDRRQPEWIMNFVTNTEEMLHKDTAAQNLLEVCLVQMPNQNLSDDDARSVLEFMRKNDGKK